MSSFVTSVSLDRVFTPVSDIEFKFSKYANAINRRTHLDYTRHQFEILKVCWYVPRFISLNIHCSSLRTSMDCLTHGLVTNCNVENPSVCFLLATTNSNLSVFSLKNIRGPGQTSNWSQARRSQDVDVASTCLCKQNFGYWSSLSFLVQDVWQEQSILIARAEYWVFIWIPQRIFSHQLNLAYNTLHYFFSGIENSFYGSSLQETN